MSFAAAPFHVHRLAWAERAFAGLSERQKPPQILHGEATLLTRGRILLDWLGPTGQVGATLKRSWQEIPAFPVSFSFPCLRYAAPRVPACVDAWAEHRHDAEGSPRPRSWTRQSLPDRFCGIEDARP